MVTVTYVTPWVYGAIRLAIFHESLPILESRFGSSRQFVQGSSPGFSRGSAAPLACFSAFSARENCLIIARQQVRTVTLPRTHMASDRAKLVLDEQSFQGLLAAAFTIQEHNARMNSGEPLDGETETTAQPKADPAQVKTSPPAISASAEVKANPLSSCKECGGPLPSADANCPNCNVPNFRPGERLQRNWASLWQMSKEQGVALDARRKPEDDLPLSPADPGRLGRDSINPSALRFAVASPEAPRSRREEVSEVPAADEAVELGHHTLDHDHPQGLLRARIELPAATRGTEEPATADAVDSIPLHDNGLNHDDLNHDGLSDGEWAESDSASESSAVAEPSDRGFKSLRVKLHFRRADLFLGLAVIVAAVALLWPASGEQKAGLSPWERVLIAMGIAEEPQQTVHFHGDPDLKVWVDTHTALYYCPGDELYGKSPDGHYTTQRDAQADRFEPAERSVCIQ